MLVLGAKGHAKEILDILTDNIDEADIIFFDDISNDIPKKLFDIFRIFTSTNQVAELFKEFPYFVLGLGGNIARRKMFEKMESLGGVAASAIASSAKISKYNVILGSGINIMHHVMISSNVSIGKGSLINAGSLIHHDVVIGDFCEISPGAIITGNVQVGNNTTVGSGAIILPKLKIGNNAIIGAGAVVIGDVEDNTTVIGVPAKKYK